MYPQISKTNVKSIIIIRKDCWTFKAWNLEVGFLVTGFLQQTLLTFLLPSLVQWKTSTLCSCRLLPHSSFSECSGNAVMYQENIMQLMSFFFLTTCHLHVDMYWYCNRKLDVIVHGNWTGYPERNNYCNDHVPPSRFQCQNNMCTTLEKYCSHISHSGM